MRLINGKHIHLRRRGIHRVFVLMHLSVDYFSLACELKEHPEQFNMEKLSALRSKIKRIAKSIRELIGITVDSCQISDAIHCVIINYMENNDKTTLLKKLEHDCSLNAESIDLYEQILHSAIRLYYLSVGEIETHQVQTIYDYYCRKLNALREYEKRNGVKEKKSELPTHSELEKQEKEMISQCRMITGEKISKIKRMTYNEIQGYIDGYKIVRIKRIMDMRAAINATGEELNKFIEGL